MILNINFLQFLRSRLPAHKQQPNRLALFGLPFQELADIWDGYKYWRDEAVIEANINHSTAVLEWWLNRNLGPGISIIENEINTGFVELSNRDEGDAFVELANRLEGTDYVELANRDEPGSVNISTDFAVLAPGSVSKLAISETVERYRAAGTTWQVIYYS